MNKNLLFALSVVLGFSIKVHSQVFTDGPMELKIRLKSVYVGFNETDATVLGSGFAPDELRIKVWAKDDANVSGLIWQGGTLLQFDMGTGGVAPMPGPTPDINDTLFEFSYPSDTVPQFFTLKVEAWEDDIPSDSLLGYCMNGVSDEFDTTRCCGNLVLGVCVGLAEGDDKRCDSNTFATHIPYRNGPPRTWFNQGYITGACGNDWKIGIETYWDIPSFNCNSLVVSTQATNPTCGVCSDGSAQATVTGGSPPYYYTWYTSPIQTTQAITGLTQGTYVVCISDSLGCLGCDSLIVSSGSCSALFDLYPDAIPHNYYAINRAWGTSPLQYLWNWGDGTFDSIPYPSHTYANAGLYSVCLKVTDAVGCADTFCNTYYLLRTTNTMVHINVIAPSITGISETSAEELLLVFPNPSANGSWQLTVGNNFIGGVAEVFDAEGRLVLKSEIRNSQSEIAPDVLRGVYLLRISSNKSSVIRKLVRL